MSARTQPYSAYARLFLLAAALVHSVSGITYAEPANLEEAEVIMGADVVGVPCNIYENDVLHEVMDRVCEVCHDMYSHLNPNMRSQC
ncbi:nudix hydrolase 6, partial [Aphelenchoides avenae]